MKRKGASSSKLLIIFAIFAIIIYQVDACSSTKKHVKVNVSPESKATPIGSGSFCIFLMIWLEPYVINKIEIL